jgi:hypothetical protein
MGDFLTFVRNLMMRRVWWVTVIIIGGLAFILARDFTWPNIIFCLIVLMFLGIGWMAISQVRRAMVGTSERKEP